MKQSASVLLLCLFLLHMVGYYPLFLLLNAKNEAAIVKMVEDEKFIINLRFPRSEIKNIVFLDEGKEFLHNGEMYDVKSSSTDGDFIVFRCIHDKTEKKLLTGLHNNVQYNTNSNSCPDKKHNNFSKNPVKEFFFPQNYRPEIFSIAVVFPSDICSVTSYIPPTLPLPPPEISLS